MNNYRKYLQGHLKEVAREEKELEQKAGLAREKAGEIARQLARRFGVTKVCLFGSLATFLLDNWRLLIHGYGKIDNKKMLQIMRKDLTDVELYLKEIINLVAAYGGDVRNGA